MNSNFSRQFEITPSTSKGRLVTFGGGNKSTLDKSIILRVTYNGQTHPVTFFLLDTFPYDILLGLDYLQVSCSRITFNNEKIQVLPRKCETNYLIGDQFFMNTKDEETFLHVSQTINVPARHTMIIKTHTKQPSDGYAMVEPYVRRSNPIQTFNSLIKIENNESFLMVTNPSEKDWVLHQDAKIAKFDDAKPVESFRAPATKPQVNPELTATQKQMLEMVLDRFLGLFEERKDYGNITYMPHRIPLVKGAQPFSSRPYQRSEADRKLVASQVQEMLKLRIIQPSESPFSSPVFLVRKRDGSARFVVDMRQLNALTVADKYPLPLITEILDTLKDAKYFTSMDLTSGYWQLHLAEEDRHKTAFITPDGLFEFKVLPFGLKNAPSGFQRMMDTILTAYRWKCCLVYLDDIIIFSPSFESHLKDLTSVMTTLQTHKIRLNGKKCKVAFTSIDFLGHVISAQGIKPDPRNVESISKFDVPKTVSKLRSFLGLASYYRRFIPNFSQIADPLNQLLQKDAKFIWTTECEQTFQKLKTLLTSYPIVATFQRQLRNATRNRCKQARHRRRNFPIPRWRLEDDSMCIKNINIGRKELPKSWKWKLLG